jgi:cyclophilin family peptidyl-prolyl cis-trans isomerase
VSNGGSSEFFALPMRDISSKRTKLLDGQYAPFGYIVKGSDVYNSLRPGDVIKATYVSELGQLNLVKIRKNAFEGGEEEEDVAIAELEEK